jgi:outer membrane protein assembly factor BamB
MSLAHRRLTLVSLLGVTLTLVLASAVPVVAGRPTADLPARIELPDGFQPEGIESDEAGNLYAGSLRDGDIWTVNVLTGEEGHRLVGNAADAGLVAVGLHLDNDGRLWVAGGPTQQIRVYSVATGDLLETYLFPTAGFINDLDISRNAVYATDSVNQQLLVIPLLEGGGLPAPSAATTMALTGDLSYSAGFNANGIAARGGWLVLVQSNEGLLFKVNPRTGETTQIDTGGYSVTNGDGLELRGDTLYVVRNFSNLVAVLTLRAGLEQADLIGEITGDVDVPTTATLSLSALWVVNARFSTPPELDTPYWITRLPTQP